MKPRQRLLAGVVLAVAALNALAYAAYTLPRTVQERRLAAEKTMLQAEVARQAAVVDSRRQYADIIRANTEDARRFRETVIAPRTASLVPMLRQIEGMAREGGLRPGAASYRVEAVRGLDVDRFVITMPVSGHYRQLVSFIERLEQSNYFLTLDQIAVRGGADTEQGGGAQLDMVLSSYFRSGSGKEG